MRFKTVVCQHIEEDSIADYERGGLILCAECGPDTVAMLKERFPPSDFDRWRIMGGLGSLGMPIYVRDAE